MQREHWLLLLIATVVCAIPVLAAAQPQAGVVMWRHATDMDVKSATDWDGSNDTADQRGRDWDLKSSGVGIRGGYTFATIFTVYGTAGVAQTTTRSIDVSDADLDMNSLGLDDGLYLDFGLGATDRFPGAEHLFWGAELSARTFSTEFDEDVTTTWDYDETTLSLGARLGYALREFGLYGGLRFVSADTDLKATDRSRLPGFQTRTIDLERDGGTDLVIGAEFRGAPVTGFVELGFVGTFGAGTGVTMHF